MSYEQLAYIYDFLMSEAPYDSWIEYFITEKERFQIKGNKVLDLACGTGEISIRLCKRGFDVTGVDLSSDMLMVAREKAAANGLSFPLYEQDMSQLSGLRSFNFVIIFCDSLNYLQTPDMVRQTFGNVYRHLVQGGLLLFDVHSVYQINEEFVNHTFALNDEDVSYIWNSFPGNVPDSAEHEISFFIRDRKTEQYNRFDEFHFQRTYPMEQYSQWLNEAGFEILQITADFTDQAPTDTSKRIFFTCKKK